MIPNMIPNMIKVIPTLIPKIFLQRGDGMDSNIPVIVGELIPIKSGRNTSYIVKVKCPYCGKQHTHGAGNDGTLLGHRLAHCAGDVPGKGKGYDIRV